MISLPDLTGLLEMMNQAYPDKIGEDTNGDGFYQGKSLELGKGGRFALLVDKLTINFLKDGLSFIEAKAKAKAIAVKIGIKKYGAELMNKWHNS